MRHRAVRSPTQPCGKRSSQCPRGLRTTHSWAELAAPDLHPNSGGDLRRDSLSAPESASLARVVTYFGARCSGVRPVVARRESGLEAVFYASPKINANGFSLTDNQGACRAPEHF